MGIYKIRNYVLTKALYNEVLIIAAEMCQRDVPSDLSAAILAGPIGKHPAFISTFLVSIMELSDRKLGSIMKLYNPQHPDNQKIEAQWRKYINSHKELQADAAIICMHVREKFCKTISDERSN